MRLNCQMEGYYQEIRRYLCLIDKLLAKLGQLVAHDIASPFRCADPATKQDGKSLPSLHL